MNRKQHCQVWPYFFDKELVFFYNNSQYFHNTGNYNDNSRLHESMGNNMTNENWNKPVIKLWLVDEENVICVITNE